MRTNPQILIKLEVDYSFYSTHIRLFCPYCSWKTKHKTRKYDSLKSLGHHIATEHKENRIYPFTLEDVHEIMKVIAKALELGILK